VTQTTQAVEAAVQSILELADNYATLKFVEGADGCEAIVDDGRNNLERVIRATLASQQEVAAPVSDAGILHIWDGFVSEPTASRPLTDGDKIAFARAVLAASRVPVASVAVDWAQIYALIARMFRQPEEVLRSMIAQDLCRLLKLGPNATDATTRAEHIAAAGKALAKDREMFGASTPATTQGPAADAPADPYGY